MAHRDLSLVVKVGLGGAVLAGAAATVVCLTRRARPEEAKASDPGDPLEQPHTSPAKAEPQDSHATHNGGGGCGRNQGPMAEWQTKVHTAAFAVGETLLALRGGSMDVRNELRSMQEQLQTLETVVQDSVYCTGKEEQLNNLMQNIDPLLSSDVSALLLHPLKGKALRESILDALASWDD
mmetsp:Transcript_19913/g.45966  ORF Transcript_19913/g.45966 Transcript_19913/m.45966 type:complete len:180 (+) Transcript_19913:50-589(+)